MSIKSESSPEKASPSSIKASSSGKSRKRQISSVYSSVTTHCWQIIDFKKQWTEARNNGQANLRSDTFSLISRPHIRFTLLFQSAEEVWSKNWHGIHLEEREENETVEVDYKFWFQNEQGHKFPMFERTNSTFGGENSNWDWHSLKKEDAALLNDLYDNNKTMYVCCQITDLNPIVEDDHQEFHMNHWTLFEQKEHDAIIRIGKTEFRVLKSYFTAQSKLFAKMFSASSKVGQISTMEVKDVKEKAMTSLVKWLYTGQLESESSASDLFIVADKYGIKLLKKLCVHRLCSTLGKKNVVWRLKIAVMYKENELKDAALLYISRMSSVEVAKIFTDSKWIDFAYKHANISNEINKLIEDKIAEPERE